MESVLLSLEPLKLEKDTIVLEELDECTAITFIEDRPFLVGFSINLRPIFKIS